MFHHTVIPDITILLAHTADITTHTADTVTDQLMTSHTEAPTDHGLHGPAMPPPTSERDE
jgi:hypothetical protein|tara:strand:- start:414 stop:593 length:180 start_codon:yes stop_codon:yes gene_type:complete